MEKPKGIMESKEAIIGMMELSLALADVLKDGAQFSDIAALWSRFSSDSVLKEKVKVALENIQEIPNEIDDLDLQEGLELAMLLIPYAPRFLEIFRRA